MTPSVTFIFIIVSIYLPPMYLTAEIKRLEDNSPREYGYPLSRGFTKPYKEPRFKPGSHHADA